ncbi:FGGY-family carbohydrate kinase [Streptomyces sp. ID05-26A]|nr:FGGY-family carbohydrate kinase [Streptomyces sp. ID05-26A]
MPQRGGQVARRTGHDPSQLVQLRADPFLGRRHVQRRDHPYRRGALLGFDGSQGRHHVYRSILEGIALTMRRHGASMAEALGREFPELIVSGGGSRSDLMMQTFADVFGRPVRRTRMSDAAGAGRGDLRGGRQRRAPGLGQRGQGHGHDGRRLHSFARDRHLRGDRSGPLENHLVHRSALRIPAP